MKDKDKIIKQVLSYTSGAVFQFWFEDDILHMWTNQRSGLYTITLDEERELRFLADVFHEPKEGTVYEFKGIFKIKRDADGRKVQIF